MSIVRLLLIAGTLTILIACAGEPTPTPPPSTPYEPSDPVLAQKYLDAGERLYAERAERWKWEDGSNWLDGVSHLLPPLPLNPDARIASGMTCAQWEALRSATFPESDEYDAQNWWSRKDADEIAAQWNANLADAIWGESPAADRWLEREIFSEVCGERMR